MLRAGTDVKKVAEWQGLVQQLRVPRFEPCWNVWLVDSIRPVRVWFVSSCRHSQTDGGRRGRHCLLDWSWVFSVVYVCLCGSLQGTRGIPNVVCHWAEIARLFRLDFG